MRPIFIVGMMRSGTSLVEQILASHSVVHGGGELEWEDQCLEFEKTERAVKTSSAMQVRKKMYTGSSDAWRKFAGHLQPLANKLAS